LQATQAVKIQFKLGKKNPVHQTLNLTSKNFKNQVQRDRGIEVLNISISALLPILPWTVKKQGVILLAHKYSSFFSLLQFI
jgi:hypothetical protein